MAALRRAQAAIEARAGRATPEATKAAGAAREAVAGGEAEARRAVPERQSARTGLEVRLKDREEAKVAARGLPIEAGSRQAGVPGRGLEIVGVGRGKVAPGILAVRIARNLVVGSKGMKVHVARTHEGRELREARSEPHNKSVARAVRQVAEVPREAGAGTHQRVVCAARMAQGEAPIAELTQVPVHGLPFNAEPFEARVGKQGPREFRIDRTRDRHLLEAARLARRTALACMRQYDRKAASRSQRWRSKIRERE